MTDKNYSTAEDDSTTVNNVSNKRDDDYLSHETWKLLYDCMVSKTVTDTLLMFDDDGMMNNVLDSDHIKRLIRSYLPIIPSEFVRYPLTTSHVYDFQRWQLRRDERLTVGQCYYLQCEHSHYTGQRDCIDIFLNRFANANGKEGRFTPFHTSYNMTANECGDGIDSWDPTSVVWCVPVDRPTGRLLHVKVLQIINPIDFPTYFQPTACRGPPFDFRRLKDPDDYTCSEHERDPITDPNRNVRLAERSVWGRATQSFYRFIEHPTVGWFCYELGTANPESRSLGYYTVTEQQFEAFDLQRANVITSDLGSDTNMFTDIYGNRLPH